MHRPAHPGLILKEWLGESGIAQAARNLGVTRTALSRIVNGKAAVSADMAARLEILLPDTDAEFWLRLQNQYDIWLARQQPHDFVVPLYAAAV